MARRVTRRSAICSTQLFCFMRRINGLAAEFEEKRKFAIAERTAKALLSALPIWNCIVEHLFPLLGQGVNAFSMLTSAANANQASFAQGC